MDNFEILDDVTVGVFNFAGSLELETDEDEDHDVSLLLSTETDRSF